MSARLLPAAIASEPVIGASAWPGALANSCQQPTLEVHWIL
jgi:hypothetical protein